LELPEFEGNETLSELHASNNFIKVSYSTNIIVI